MLNHPYIAKLLIEARIDDLRRDAGGLPSQSADADALRRRRSIRTTTTGGQQ